LQNDGSQVAWERPTADVSRVQWSSRPIQPHWRYVRVAKAMIEGSAAEGARNGAWKLALFIWIAARGQKMQETARVYRV